MGIWDKPPKDGKPAVSSNDDKSPAEDWYGKALVRSVQNERGNQIMASEKLETAEERAERREKELRIKLQERSATLEAAIAELPNEVKKWSEMPLASVQKILYGHTMLPDTQRTPEQYKEDQTRAVERQLQGAEENRMALSYALEALTSGRNHEQAEEWLAREEKKHAEAIAEAKRLGTDPSRIKALERKRAQLAAALTELQAQWDIMQKINT